MGTREEASHQRRSQFGSLPLEGLGRRDQAPRALSGGAVFPLPVGEGQGEGGFELVPDFDFPHPGPLLEGEGVFTWRLWPSGGGRGGILG